MFIHPDSLSAHKPPHTKQNHVEARLLRDNKDLKALYERNQDPTKHAVQYIGVGVRWTPQLEESLRQAGRQYQNDWITIAKLPMFKGRTGMARVIYLFSLLVFSLTPSIHTHSHSLFILTGKIFKPEKEGGEKTTGQEKKTGGRQHGRGRRGGEGGG
jgi:hypothetical protein